MNMQEDKELLLKNLCARLPNNMYKIGPYLFPLSSMTDE